MFPVFWLEAQPHAGASQAVVSGLIGPNKTRIGKQSALARDAKLKPGAGMFGPLSNRVELIAGSAKGVGSQVDGFKGRRSIRWPLPLSTKQCFVFSV